MPGIIDLSLDGLYRAIVIGLQTGLATVLIFWLVDMFGIHLLSCCPTFWLGTLIGAAYMLYKDTLKVLAFFKNCVNIQ
jgi:hypothetical protein